MEIPSNEQEIQSLTWSGGPTHHVQKQHIPGYCGHVAGLKAENLHGQPYAKLTAETLNDRMTRGFIIDDKARLQTTSGTAFAHPKGESAPLSSTLKVNADVLNKTSGNFTGKAEDDELPPIDRVPVSGYQGYRPTYRNPVKKAQQPQPEEFQTTKYVDHQINHVLNHTEQRLDLDRPVPVVGYTGFVQGQKAKNNFGRSYHNVVLESKIKQYS